MFEDDNDAGGEDEFDLNDTVVDNDNEPAAPAAPAAPAEQAKPDQETLNALATATYAVKSAWVDKAKASGLVAADFNGIGITSLDPAGEQAFLAAAKASHDARVEELRSLGFVQQDPNTTSMEVAEAAAAAAWGQPTQPVDTSTDEKASQVLEQAVRSGDTQGTLKAMLQTGLGDFFRTGRSRHAG